MLTEFSNTSVPIRPIQRSSFSGLGSADPRWTLVNETSGTKSSQLSAIIKEDSNSFIGVIGGNLAHTEI